MTVSTDLWPVCVLFFVVAAGSAVEQSWLRRRAAVLGPSPAADGPG